MVFPLLALTTQTAYAQTASQMEYERQQREYRRQLEQQQQEQQRLQQQMNENARRQQEEARRLNAPAAQDDAAPAYQGASPQGARRPATQVDVAAAVAAKDWEAEGSSLKGEADFYVARSTISRSGDFAKMWEMIDHKTAQAFDGKPFLSIKSFQEYDCKRSRRRMLAATAYSGHIGKGTVVGSEFFTPPSPWEAVGAGGYSEHFLKLACAKK
jgi:hypothetical protein